MTITAVFDHRGRAQKNGNGPIEIRITINRRVFYINTGIRIKASQFRFGSIINHDQSDELNERVRILISKIEREINSCLDNDCNLDIAKLRKIANSTPSDEKKNNTLLEWIDEQIQLLNIAHGTRKHYKKLLVALYDYGQLTSFSDVRLPKVSFGKEDEYVEYGSVSIYDDNNNSAFFDADAAAELASNVAAAAVELAVGPAVVPTSGGGGGGSSSGWGDDDDDDEKKKKNRPKFHR